MTDRRAWLPAACRGPSGAATPPLSWVPFFLEELVRWAGGARGVVWADVGLGSRLLRHEDLDAGKDFRHQQPGCLLLEQKQPLGLRAPRA